MGEAHNAVNTELAIKKHMHRVSSQLVICQKINLPPPPNHYPNVLSETPCSCARRSSNLKHSGAVRVEEVFEGKLTVVKKVSGPEG